MPPLIDGRLRAEVFRSIDGIGQHVVSTSKQYFRSETGVVAVLTSASVFEQLLAPTPAVSDQLSRVNEDITVLSVAETASMHGRIGKYSKSDGVFVPTSDYQLDDVRNYHLRCLFEPFGAAAIRRSGETFHYVAPSGLHCVAFLRLADALRSMQIIEGFSFWLHEHVAGADAVILDTWGIDRLLFRSLIRSAADRPYRCLEQYPESDGEISTLVSQLLASSPRPDDRPLRLLLLVSVNSSGTLISRVTRAVQEANESIELSVVSLVAIGPSAMSSAAFMKLPEVDPENATAENCKRCPLPAYRIDPRHYYQRAPFEQEIQLKARYFKGPSRKFLDKFGKHPGLVKLHEPLPLGPSHRAFDIEASILLSLAEAKEEIEHKLDDDRAGLILTIGPAASTIGKNFADKKSIGWLDASSIVGTREPDETEKAVLGTDGAVSLIVEKIGDVHLAQAIGRFLRDHVLRASQVRVLFCLDICASEEVAAAVKKQIEDNGAKFRPQKSEPVFVCRLPDAAFPCPWCFELEWLEKKSSKMVDSPHWLLERIELLKRSGGASVRPLISKSGFPPLSPGSHIADPGLPEAGIVAAVACGLHLARQFPQNEFRLQRSMVASHVLTGEFEFTQLSEPVLRAAVLRSSKADDWSDDGSETRTARLLADNVGEGLSGEMLLAASRKIVKAPSFDIEDVWLVPRIDVAPSLVGMNEPPGIVARFLSNVTGWLTKKGKDPQSSR